MIDTIKRLSQKYAASKRWAKMAVAAACILAFAPAPAEPQVRAQLQELGGPGDQPFAGDPFAADEVVDFRENMRLLVQNTSAFARAFNPNFVILAEDGLGLVSKPNPEDETQLFPARAFVRAIDGVLELRLLERLAPYVSTDGAQEDPALTARRDALQQNLKTARRLGVKVLNLEFSEKPKEISGLLTQSSTQGFAPFVGSDPILGDVPENPKRAFNANPQNLDDIRQARNFIYVANSQGFGTASDYVQALSMTNHDVIITSVFHGRQPLSKLDVHRLKYKKLGARRLVLAELDLSSAATYHYYWQENWRQGAPAFISLPYVEDPDRFRTIYWDPGWQRVLFGDANSYLYGIIDLGFDGVVLKGLRAWRYFESGGEEE